MKTPPDSVSALAPTIVGIALLLLIAAAGARMLGLLPNSIGGLRSLELLSAASAEENTSSRASSNVRGRWRCPECGVIVSMREIGADIGGGAADPGGAIGVGGTQGASASRYEFVVRMGGGARRVIIDTIPTRWREGERVIVIDGTSPARQ